MKGTIVYKGKYGATKQYAEWLGKALDATIVTPEKFTAPDLLYSDYIVIGSSVYIGELQLHAWLRENADMLKTKKLFLFIVCGTPSTDKEKTEMIIKRNIPTSLQQSEIYFFPGRVIRQQLSWKDRLLLRIGSMFAKKPAEKETMSKDFDRVAHDHINPLVNSVKKLYTAANIVSYA